MKYCYVHKYSESHKSSKKVCMFTNFRSESFDDANLSHETQLLELWTLLQPDRPLLKRVTKQWQDIGECAAFENFICLLVVSLFGWLFVACLFSCFLV